MDRKRPNLTRCLKLAQPFDLWFIRNHYDIYTSARNYSFFDETSPVLSYLEVTLFWNDYKQDRLSSEKRRDAKLSPRASCGSHRRKAYDRKTAAMSTHLTELESPETS
jgi:hypothetical protein